VGHGEDVTVYKQQNDVLNKHNSKKNSILNILAHDLAGPIGNIANLSVLIERETASLNNARIHGYLQLVKKISDNSIHLIRDFMNQEFLESQGIKLIKRRVELVSKITMVIQEYIDMQKDLQLSFFCHANRKSIYAEIDEDKFLQVINNLISNSMKFTPDGGTITINLEERERTVLITITDTGVGIPEKYHATLFDKFSEARRTGLKGQPSTGLGMSIIKTIVEWHQGNIWFDSEENKGTTFYIETPR
jgi:two-component system sensor histidine kinase VicK